VPGFQLAARGDVADQLVIRQPGQARPVLAGDGVDDGGQQRVGGHVGGRAGLGELARVQGPGGQAQEQALLRRPGVGRAAVRLLAVVAWVAERVRAHAPRSVREEGSDLPRANYYLIIGEKLKLLANLFLNNVSDRRVALDGCF
jgi:hypothetical protein